MATNTEKDSQIAETNLTTMENPPLVDSDSDDGILSTYSLPTLPEITKSSEEQQSLLTRSQYAMVVFHGVADTYPTDSDIVCRYSLTDGVEAVQGDRVVLFAVGWSSIKDYIVFEWAPIPEKDERDLTVVFKAADLPKDVNEFYQVCYVSNEGAVCGASVPFQVRTPNSEELTFALEEDMVVVRSSTAVAQDKLLKAQLDRENLNKNKLNLEKQLRSLEDTHSLTLRRLDRLQETLSTSNALNEELKKENARLLVISDQMSHTKNELEETRTRLDDTIKEKNTIKESLEAEIKSTEDHREKLETKTKELEKGLIDTTKKILALQKEQEELRAEIVAANGNLQQTEHERSSLATRSFSLENELTVCKFNLNNSQLETLKLKAEMEELTEANKTLNAELKCAKQFEEMHTEFSTTDRGRLIMDNTRFRKTMEEMQLAISTLEHEKSTLERILEDTLNAEKNVCSDHCSLEKVVAQLQYQLEEAENNEKAKEKQEVCSHNKPSCSSSENQVVTLEKLLDDSLKENELRQQENMALRVQNEFLETRISKDQSKLEEFVVVSTCDHSRSDQNTNAAQSHPYITGTTDSCAKRSALKVEIGQLRHRTKIAYDHFYLFAEKDEEIRNLQNEIAALKEELLEAGIEHKAELAQLVSKNADLVEQEIQSQELKNEMQRITFMNEELLMQNASLMERIHDSKNSSTTSIGVNVLQKGSNTENLDTTLKIEIEELKEEVETLSESLNVLIAKYREQEERNKSLENELDAVKILNVSAEKRSSSLVKQYDILLQSSAHSESKVKKCQCCAEPKLEQISQSVDHLLSAMENLTSCSGLKQGSHSSSNDTDELKYRLQLAREEYEKLHTVMATYRTKYNELKSKYMKKAGKIHHSST